MKTYLGVHPNLNVFILGEPRQGRIEIDVPEEDLTRYQLVLKEYEKVHKELHNIYVEASRGVSTNGQKV